MNRRSFLKGLIAAPVVIKASSLMPVRGLIMATQPPPEEILDELMRHNLRRLSQQVESTIMYGNSEFEPLQFTGFAIQTSIPYSIWCMIRYQG